VFDHATKLAYVIAWVHIDDHDSVEQVVDHFPSDRPVNMYFDAEASWPTQVPLALTHESFLSPFMQFSCLHG
jgi:hypothetical protein